MPRGDKVTASERWLDRFRSGDIDWQGAKRHFGLVLSGEKLINDPKFRKSLLKFEPEAIGGEMEGAGLYAAARDAKVDRILVKAICDWADGNKNDDAQELAARNAAQFIHHVLRLGGWDKTGSDEEPTPARKPKKVKKAPVDKPAGIPLKPPPRLAVPTSTVVEKVKKEILIDESYEKSPAARYVGIG